MEMRLRKWRLPVAAGAGAIALIGLLVLQPWSASLGPEEALAAAREGMIGLQSFRMESSSTVTQEGETTESSYQLGYSAPDRYHIRSEVDGQSAEFLVIGDQIYSRQPDEMRSWAAEAMIMGLSGSVLAKELTLSYLEALVDVEELPDETIDGADALHYQGSIDLGSDLEDMIAELDPDDSRYESTLQTLEFEREWFSKFRTEVEFWIGKDDHLLHRMRYFMRMPSRDSFEEDSETAEQEEWDSVSMVVRYYDFNAEISIEAPLSDSGELLPGWHLVGDASATSREPSVGVNMVFSIGGADLAHSRIEYHITVTNTGEDIIRNVRVSITTKATDDREEPEIEAEPSDAPPIDLEPRESQSYQMSWQYDAGDMSKLELIALVEESLVLVRYAAPDGSEREYSVDYPQSISTTITPMGD